MTAAPTTELEQIRTCYENLKMSPLEISEDRGLDVSSVKAGLMQVSSQYRRDCNSAPIEDEELNFSNDELKMVNQRIMHLALYAESEELQGRMCQYVRDDKKGRKEVVKAVQNSQVNNILVFNEQMAKIRSMADGAKKSILDVEHVCKTA